MKPRLDPIERFLDKIEAGGPEGCWQWIAGLTGAGYAAFRYGTENKNGLGHRFAYELFVGPIPDGLELDHLCENRACVNPWHLEAVTHHTNVMRGTAPASENALKTHCLRDHPLSGDNLRVSKDGRRICRACANESAKRWSEANPEKRREAGLRYKEKNLEARRAYGREYRRKWREARKSSPPPSG